MLLSEKEARVWIHLKDSARKTDQGLIDRFLNEGAVEFNDATGIFRVRTQLIVTNGAATLMPTPDPVDVLGKILRVEDANNGNKGLTQTSENTLDVTVGPSWRNDTSGPLKNWMRGTPNEGTQTGYETILTYPAVPGGLVNVFYVKNPRKLTSDADVDDIPARFHIAEVWYAVEMIAALAGMNDMATFAGAKWKDQIDRAEKETASWLTRMAG